MTFRMGDLRGASLEDIADFLQDATLDLHEDLPR